MKTSSLEILESSELPDAQARAILKVLEQEMSSSQELLATKADLEHLRLATKADLNAVEGKLSWMVLGCFFTQLAVTVALAGVLYFHTGR